MKFIVSVSLFLCLKLPAFAQNYCDVDRFDRAIFDSADLEIISNIKYGSAINNLGIDQDLYLDIYHPNPDVDTMIKKPLIVFVHGGGLVGGDKNSAGSVDLGYLYARSGFVYATINYRLGWDKGEQEDGCGGDTTDLFKATYRAVQDVRAALRFLKANAEIYGIDTNYIIVQGNSAGSRIIMFATYAEQENYRPEFFDEMGSIDTSGNDIINSNFNPIALITEAGGIEQPELLLRKEIPFLFFHGTCDSIVPYFAAPAYFCYEPFPYPDLYGSWELTEMYKALGRTYQFYTGEGAGHDVALPDTIYQYSKSFIKEIFCGNPTTKEFYRVLGKKKCAIGNKGELNIESLYPNPVSDNINLTVTSTQANDVELYIYNVIGQTFYTTTLDFYPPIKEYSLDVSFLNHGMYFLQIRQQYKMFVRPFVK